MSILAAVALAIVEGLAGVLMLSGAGHLLIAEKLLGVSEQPINFLFFAVVLHIGNLLAILICCRRRIVQLFVELLKMLHIVKTPRQERKKPSLARRELSLLLIALVPMLLSIAFIGLTRAAYSSEQRLLYSGIGLAISGGVLFLCERFYRGHKDERSAGPADALLIGLAQAFSVFPGVSRAAVSVGTGVLRGFKRSYAVEFSCLMAVPVILAALVEELITAGSSGAIMPELWVCVLAVAVCTVVSVFALKLLERVADYGRFDNFAYLCWGAGIVSVVLLLIT